MVFLLRSWGLLQLFYALVIKPKLPPPEELLANGDPLNKLLCGLQKCLRIPCTTSLCQSSSCAGRTDFREGNFLTSGASSVLSLPRSFGLSSYPSTEWREPWPSAALVRRGKYVQLLPVARVKISSLSIFYLFSLVYSSLTHFNHLMVSHFSLMLLPKKKDSTYI